MGVITQDQLYEAAQYVYNCLGGPYVAWYSGEVSGGEGPPAWGVNAPPPKASEVRSRGAFCVAVSNLMYRHLGLKIPNPFNDEAYDGGIVSSWEAYYSSSEWFDVNTSYPDGTFVMSPYNSAALGDQGHIAMIWHYNGVPYCMEWIFNPGGTWNYTLRESNAWGQYQIAIRPAQWVPLAGGSFDAKPQPTKPTKPTDPMKYPGDLADPDVVARWMARVAYEEYGLPPVLPVMCSYVELTGAWTGPGDVKTVPGYLGAVDYDSLGYFQQRPSQGWGTPSQLTDADYALRKFCSVAYENSGGTWNKDQTGTQILGEWCQAVQRSAFPNAYRDKGYPAAMKLIEGWNQGGDEPVKPKPDESKELWQLYGWYTFESDTSWSLTYYPPEGKSSPVEPDKSTWKKAMSKPEEVKYREVGDGVEVEDDGLVSQYSPEEFAKYYQPVEEKK